MAVPHKWGRLGDVSTSTIHIVTAPKWLDEREHRAWRNLQYLRGPLGAVLNRQLTQDSGMSTADYEVLAVLSDQDCGRLRVGELGLATGWEKSRLSHHITRMVARGLVARELCADDGRAAYVVLTDHGRAAIAEAAPAHLEAVRAYVIDALSPEQLDTLADIGAAVAARLAAACAQHSADDCADE